MSGGAFNYLAFSDFHAVVDSKMDNLKAMAERLREIQVEYRSPALAYAADRTALAVTLIEDCEKVFTEISNELERVWLAVEWYDSGDSGFERVKMALRDLRKTIPKPDS